MCNLYKVRKQLIAAVAMKKYTVSKGEAVFFLTAVFGFPLFLAFLAGATKPLILEHASNTYRIYYVMPEEPEAYEQYKSLYAANNMRGQFTCQFFFDSDLDEMVLYVLPLLFYSLMCTAISFHLLILVRVMGRNAAGADGVKGKKAKKNESIIRLAKNMMRFAVVACTLAALNVAANLDFVPKAVQFGIDVSYSVVLFEFGCLSLTTLYRLKLG